MKLIFVSIFVTSVAALWPLPTSYKHGNTVLWIPRDVEFIWYEVSSENVGHCSGKDAGQFVLKSESDTTGETQDSSSVFSPRKRYTANFTTYPASSKKGGVTGEDILDYAVALSRKIIFEKNLYPWKFHPRNWSEPSPASSHGTKSISKVGLKLRSTAPQNIAKPLAGGVDESYALTLTEDGAAEVIANTSIGLARGLTTFTQLYYFHSNGKDAYTPFAPVQIFDEPKFEHRGINLDVSRNYFPVADIKRQIDALAYNKMNRFHLHVTDSQSWPLEIPTMPELSAKGAYRPDLVYTAKDFAKLQYHAAIQGVEMITEIDMPGHTSSIYHSHPDLIAAFDFQPNWHDVAAEPPSGTLKLNSTAVYDFLEKLFDDLLPRVAPYSSYFHTGGDEVNKNAYNYDDTVKSSDYAVLQPLMQKFVDRNHNQVRAKGLIPVVWEEMLLDWKLQLGDDVIVQSWQSSDAIAQIVAKGHKVLVGNYNYWYLDCGKGQWLDLDPSIAGSAWPYNDYCAPFHNWRLIYSYDPLDGVPEANQHLVIGGEAHMWAEQTDPVNVDRMIWPRAAAAAEILWRGAKDENGNNRSQIEASPRLSEMRERLVAMGVGAEPIQMPYCLMAGSPQCQSGYRG